jgi:hypothetical protein
MFDRIYDIAVNHDPPFSYPEADERTKQILVGQGAQEYRREFQAILVAAMQQSMMTAIIGPPGSGKTQFIHHLEWKTNDLGEYRGVVIVLKPAGNPLTVDGLLQYIAQDERFQHKATEAGVPFDWLQPGTKERMARSINEAIARMRSHHGDNTIGILLAVDNVDEHLRLLAASGDPGAARRQIQAFLGVLRLLLSEVRGLCILLALTEDGYNGIAGIIAEDQSLNRRFMVPQGPGGQPFTLRRFEEEEAYDLVAAHLDNWAKRNGITPPAPKAARAGERNLFPFTPDAVELFWRAALYPGLISQGCKMALIHKVLSGRLPRTEEEALVGRGDAAQVLLKYNSMFPNFEAVRDEIQSQALAPLP